MRYGEAYIALEAALRRNGRYDSVLPAPSAGTDTQPRGGGGAGEAEAEAHRHVSRFEAVTRQHDRVRDLYITAAQVRACLCVR